MNQNEELFKDWDLNGEGLRFYNMTISDLITKLENPNVPLILIASRGFKTFKKIEYSMNLFDLVKDNVYGNYKAVFGSGDDTVPSYSAIIPGLKWAWEFSKMKRSSKPVKIVDYCSYFNEKYNPYDVTDQNKPFEANKNDFFGIQCDCITSKNKQTCIHPSIISDTHLIRFLENTFQAN